MHLRRVSMGFAMMVAVVLALPAAPARAETLDAVLARAKAASGGDAVDALAATAAEGELVAGGMTGTIRTTVDARTGRFVARFDLGPVTGAEGDDGKTRWTVGAGGEVQVQDSVAGRASAANGRWLASLGYWFPQRRAATMRYVGVETIAGQRSHVVEATPAGGRLLRLGFDVASARLTRIVDSDGTITTTTSLSDFRDVDGVMLPFEQRDSTGDAKYDTVQRWRRITRTASVDDAAFAMPAAALADFRVDGDAAVVTLPFDLVNNHIYIDARANGQPVRMLVDTGGANILTPEAARRIGVVAEGALEGRGVGEGTTDVGLARLESLTVGAAHFAKPVFYTFDIAGLSDIEGVDFDGIVGFEVFRRFVVEIDYAKRALHLHDPKRFDGKSLPWTPITFADTTPLVKATLDGVTGEFTLDTGSRSSLSLHSPFARRHDAVKRFDAGVERITGWGVGGPMKSRLAMMPGLVLGGHRLPTFAGDIYTGTKGAFAQDDVIGNIGGAVLRRFTVTFDYANRRVAFVPNGDAGALEPADRSGLWLNRDGDGYVVVECVAATPCAKAGLAAGDRIVTIDGVAARTVPVADARARLRGEPGTRVTLGIARDGAAARDATLTLADPFAATR